MFTAFLPLIDLQMMVVDDVPGLGKACATKKAGDILVLGRRSGLVGLSKKEGGRLSTSSSTSAKNIYKQNSSDIRKADKIIFNEKGVPNSLQEALKNGGQYSRAERELILSRPDLLEKTVFK